MKPFFCSTLLIIPLSLGLLFGLLGNARAQTFTTWDPQGTNGLDPYTGSLSGSWEGSNWDPLNETGTNSPVAWVEDTTALFGANTGVGTPAFIVTMNSGHTVAGIYDGGQTPGPCTVTINGSGAMTLPAGLQTFNVVSPGALAISNNITGGGGIALSGSGTLTLYGTNSFTGASTIGTGCALTVAGAGKLGSGNYAGALDDEGTFTYGSSAAQTISAAVTGAGNLVVNKGTLTLSKVNSYSGGTAIASGATLTLAAGGTLASAGVITNNGTFNYNNPASATISGTISGSGALIANPGGSQGLILTLSGANTYTGPTVIEPPGQIVISSDNNLGTPPSAFTANQLQLYYGFLKANGSFTLSPHRGITLIGGVGGAGGSIQVNGGDTLTIAAPIVGPYAMVFGSGEPNFGAGTNLLANTNNFLGGTALSTGRLLLGTNGALPYGRSVVMAPDDFGGPFLDLGGFSQTIGPLSTTNSFVGVSASGTPTIVLNGTLTILQTNIAAAFSGQIYGTGTLILSGNSAGKLILSNYASSYTGGTIINGGTLDISPASSISGNVTVNGGTLQLENSAALATAANLTVAASGTVNLDFSGTQTIGTLVFGSTPQATGYWGAPGNPAASYTSSQLTGGGLLFVCPTPDQTITPAANPVCAGVSTTASVPVTAGATYSWSVNNGIILSNGTSSTMTYSAWANGNPVVLNCVVTSACGISSAGNQNTNVAVNICGQVVASTNVTYNAQNGATITGAGVIGANWVLNASTNLSAPLPWPTIQSGNVSSSPFTVTDPSAPLYPQQFYYLTNSP